MRCSHFLQPSTTCCGSPPGRRSSTAGRGRASPAGCSPPCRRDWRLRSRRMGDEQRASPSQGFSFLKKKKKKKKKKELPIAAESRATDFEEAAHPLPIFTPPRRYFSIPRWLTPSAFCLSTTTVQIFKFPCTAERTRSMADLRHAQRNVFRRRDARQQSRLFARENPRLRHSPTTNRRLRYNGPRPPHTEDKLI